MIEDGLPEEIAPEGFAFSREAERQFRKAICKPIGLVNLDLDGRGIPGYKVRKYQEDKLLSDIDFACIIRITDIDKIIGRPEVSNEMEARLVRAKTLSVNALAGISDIRTWSKSAPKSRKIDELYKLNQEATSLSFDFILAFAISEQWPNRVFVGSEGQILYQSS